MIRAGFGSADITPDTPVFLAGFGARTQPANDVHDPLEARAVYIGSGTTAVCLVVCDLLGMSNGYSRPVREAIASALGVPLGAVLVACTHTHSGPSTIAGTEALGWPPPDGYRELLVEGCASAAARARDAAIDAELRYVRAPQPDGFAFNRRGLPYEDPWFSVLDIVGGDGRLGVVANLSIHPVLLGPGWLKVATDWVGPFRSALSSSAGGEVVFLNGTLGDINPVPPGGEPDDSYEPWATEEQTTEYGEALAAHVARAIDSAEPLDPTIEVLRADTIDVPVGGTALAQLVEGGSLSVDLVEWAIGDVRVVSVPGEGFHLLGQEVSRARGDRAILAGIAPSWNGYLPHPWGEGYEEGVSYGPDAVRAMREAITDPPAERAARADR